MFSSIFTYERIIVYVRAANLICLHISFSTVEIFQTEKISWNLIAVVLTSPDTLLFQCVYTFVAGPGERVKLEFEHFHLAGSSER